MPKVVTWFRVYCAVLCFLYLAWAGMSLAFFLVSPEELEMSATEARLTGSFLMAIGLILLGVCLVPLVVKPRPWVWVYDIVIIAFGMTSVCFIPFVVPLLIFWLKPETKAYFGRTEPGIPPSATGGS